jgi:predicted TIM-barrel fold metal-dependent hydrolase
MNVVLPCGCEPRVPEGFYLAQARRKSAPARRPAAKKAKAKAKPASPRHIDVHHHIAPPEYFKLKTQAQLGAPNARRDRLYEGWNPGVALESMDEGGTATAVTSTSDGQFIAMHPERVRIARDCNEYAAKMQQDYPGRFGHFATMPMPDVDACLTEIEYALGTLKFDGVDIRTSYGMKWLGNAEFEPIYKELNRRKAVVYCHPHEPVFAHNLLPGVTGATIEYCADSTRAIASILFGEVVTKYPNVKFIFSHGGGTLPFLLDRFRGLATHPQHEGKFPKGIGHEIRRLYYECAQAIHPGALDALLRMAPLDHVLFGTDFPHFTAKYTAKRLGEYDGFGARELAAINRGNALKLFPRFA